MAAKKEKFLTYKGIPLVRCKDIIYYGNPSDKYIIMLQILDHKQIKDLSVANKVLVQLQLTDPDISAKDRIVKSSEKNGLYNAMDLGAIWLERALS